MIPVELYEAWEEHEEREELLFLADHGGGWPNCLIKFVSTPEDRLRILRQMGFSVEKTYVAFKDESGDPVRMAILTNGIGVNLEEGSVLRLNDKKGAEARL